MKILILSTKVPFPPKDGGAIATLSLAEGLADCGNEVSMLCMNTDKHPYDVNRIHSVLKKKIRFFSVDVKIRLNPLRAFFNLIFSDKPYNAIRFRSGKYSQKLIEILHDEKWDIIQLEGPYNIWYIPVIRKNSKAVVSLRAHNVEHEIWQRKALKSKNFFQRFYFNILAKRVKNLEKQVLRKADLLVAISERDRVQLNLLQDIKSITIPTGLNPYRYPAPKPPEFPSIFYIGALDWMPNQEGILWFLNEVFPKIHAEIKDVRLHIAGRNAPEWLANKLNKQRSNAVVFHGEVENAYAFMNKYAVFVSPLFTGSGIRIKILEGMMMQRVIVATPTAAEGLPVDDRKNIFITNDVSVMASTIVDLCKDREKYNEIAANSRDFVNENFNNLATSQRLSDYYRNEKV